MKRNYWLMVCMVFLFAILPLSSAQPTFTDIQTTNGYQIEPTAHAYIKTGDDYTFSVGVFNKTNGVPITSGISCHSNLYDQDGSHKSLVSSSTVVRIFDYEMAFDGGNFTNRGEYTIKIGCNSTDYGGGTEFSFYVNDYGQGLKEGEGWMFYGGSLLLFLLFLMSLVGIFKVDDYKGKFALYWVTHVLFIALTFSIWQFNEGYTLAFTGLSGVFKIMFYVSTIAVFPMVLLSLAWIFYIHTMNDDIKKMMNRGMDEGEAYDRAKRRKKW
mgnify:CR=1 FL=1